MTDELAQTNLTGALRVPEHLKDVHGREGFENVTRDDVILPRLSICQAMSPQRKKANVSYIEGLSDGDLFNTITGQVYGSSALIIPMLFSKSRIYFRPLSEGGGILCQSFNGRDGGSISPTCDACPNSKFSADGKPPSCNLFHNYPVILLPQHELVVLSLKSTGLKVAKQWNSRMQLLGDKPMYVGVYEIIITEQTNNKGNFFSPMIRFKRFVDADELKFASNLYATLKGKTIKVDEEGLGEQDQDVPF